MRAFPGVALAYVIMAIPAVSWANIYGCSGWAEGRNGGRLDVRVSEEAVAGWNHAEWTPPHSGGGGLALELVYGVHAGHLSDLRRVWISGDVEREAIDTDGRVTISAGAGKSWRTRWRVDSAIDVRTSKQTKSVTAVVASTRPNYPGERLIHPERMAVIEGARSLAVTFADRPGTTTFSGATYDLSALQERDQLFELAHARAWRALRDGCPRAETTCRCGG